MQKELRKAAILFSSLDPPSAEALLAQLDPSTSRRIREAARALRSVDPREQQEVLEEFFAKKKDPATVTPAEALAAASGDEVVLQHADRTPAARRPFQFLETIDPEQLAARLMREHPQTIAIVAANAPRRLAAELLCRLPSSLRCEVLVRVIDGRPTEPQLLEEVEQTLQVSLAAFSHSPTAAAGLEAAREILEAAQPSQRSELLNDLANRDARRAELLRSPASHGITPTSEKRVLAENFAATKDSKQSQPRQSDESGERPATIPFAPAARRARTPKAIPPRREIPFAEFATLDDRALLRVFAAADPQSALLALVGARPQLVNRLMRRLSRKEAAQLQRRMETLGPFRLQDIEAAQQELAHLAGRLVSRQRRAA
jgi:flagellar motor switch protein FliG